MDMAKYPIITLFVLMGILMTCAGCTGVSNESFYGKQADTGTANDNAFVKFLGSYTLAKDMTKFEDDLKYNQFEAARIDMQAIVRDYENSPIPDNPDLRQARSLYISGNTQIAQGDFQGGINTMRPAKALVDNWVSSHRG
jgi:hypothetical protein